MASFDAFDSPKTLGGAPIFLSFLRESEVKAINGCKAYYDRSSSLKEPYIRNFISFFLLK